MGSMDSAIAEENHEYSMLCKEYGCKPISGEDKYHHHQWLKTRKINNTSFELYLLIKHHEQQDERCKSIEKQLDIERTKLSNIYRNIIKYAVDNR